MSQPEQNTSLKTIFGLSPCGRGRRGLLFAVGEGFQIDIFRGLFVFFVLLHVAVWTLLPLFFRFNLPMDALEGVTWGHQWQWGYDKNPFLNALLTHLAVLVGGPSGWMIYLFSQLSVAVCFWAVWDMGKRMLSPLHALVAVMLLEGLQYYNFHAIDFNDNTLELPLWALTILFVWRGLTEKTAKRLRWWIFAGFSAGLGMMAKYYTLVLLFSLGLFFLANARARAALRGAGPWVMAGICLLVMLPHVLWLFEHDFVTVRYVFARAGSEPHWWNFLFFPAQFAWQQLEVILPGLLLALPFFWGRSRPVLQAFPRVNAFDRQFVWYAGTGPLAVTVLLAFFFGIKLRAGWGQPLFSLFGVLLLLVMRPAITKRRFAIFFLLWSILFAALATGYAMALWRAKSPSSALFPGKMLAGQLEGEWHARFHQPLRWVAGPRWFAGNLAFYSRDQPAVYMEANPRVTQWVDESKLIRQGGIFLWEEGNTDFEASLRKRFVGLGPTVRRQLTWHRNAALAPIVLRVAFLPPDLSKG